MQGYTTYLGVIIHINIKVYCTFLNQIMWVGERGNTGRDIYGEKLFIQNTTLHIFFNIFDSFLLICGGPDYSTLIRGARKIIYISEYTS